ncbi:MFS transporter [Micromonospora chalcea]
MSHIEAFGRFGGRSSGGRAADRLPRRTRSGVFALFAGLCVVGFLFVRRYLPETRGRTLEQIQQMWVADYDRRKRTHTGP